jgi:hypothetical protein
MRRFALVAVALLLAGGFAPAAFAQEHGQIGVGADYFRLSQTKMGFAGVGGHLSVNTNRNLQLEAEMGYDFAQPLIEGFTNTGTGAVTLQRTNTRILHGLFGPKLQTSRGPLRAFLTVKGGFLNFRLDPRPATFSTFASSVENLRANNVTGVFYPGVGLEAHLGPLGLRLDAGDEMYFTGGTHHNLRVEFGPIIRF